MPRPTHDPLTDSQVRALTPGAVPIDVRDGELRGLILTVLPSGRKQFALRYRAQGKQRRLVLGDYPSLSLAKARKLARQKQAEIDGGADPAAVRQAVRRAPTDTVEALAAEYLRKHAKHKRSAGEDERILKVDVLPYWRQKSVKALTRRDVRALIERVAERAPIMANRVLAVVRKMLNFAVDHDWIDANPAARVQKPSKEGSRDRVLNPDEIRRLWRLLERFPTTEELPAPGRPRARGTKDDPICPVSPALAALQKMRLLTAQRGGEVARMKWSDLTLPPADPKVPQVGWWTIPGSDTKNSEAHRVPLTAPALEIIRAQDQVKDQVRTTTNLPERVTGKDSKSYPASRQTETTNADGNVFVGSGASLMDRAKKAPAAISRALGIDFRGHDLRRTAATGMAESGVPREHIAHVLNHVDGGSRATKIYDRYSYDAEKLDALQAWARKLTAILGAQDQARSGVVPFRGVAK